MVNFAKLSGISCCCSCLPLFHPSLWEKYWNDQLGWMLRWCWSCCKQLEQADCSMTHDSLEKRWFCEHCQSWSDSSSSDCKQHVAARSNTTEKVDKTEKPEKCKTLTIWTSFLTCASIMMCRIKRKWASNLMRLLPTEVASRFIHCGVNRFSR